MGEALGWARGKYPGIDFDIKDVGLDTLRPTLTQFDKLATEYPEVADRMNRIYSGSPSSDSLSGAYAWASRDGKEIGLGSKWYGNAAKYLDSLRECVETKWHPTGCDSIESVVTHEFGHHVMNWMVAQKGSLLEYVLPSGFGYVSELPRFWSDKNIRQRNKISQYARKSMEEFFAEAFAQLEHAPSPSIAAQRLAKIIDAARDGGRRIVDHKWQFDAKDPETRARVAEAAKRLREELEL